MFMMVSFLLDTMLGSLSDIQDTFHNKTSVRNNKKKVFNKNFCEIPDYEVKPSPCSHDLKVKNATVLQYLIGVDIIRDS